MKALPSDDFMVCRVCGSAVGEHLGECPAGAQPLPYRHLGHNRHLIAPPDPDDMPRETLRLRVEDQDPEQPDLFGGSL